MIGRFVEKWGLKMCEASESGEFTFHLEEYRNLRSEIQHYQERRHQLNRLCIAGLFAMFFALLGPYSHQLSEFYRIAWLAPFCLSFGCYAFQERTHRAIRSLGGYIKDIENKYANVGLKGWETTIFALRALNPTEEEKKIQGRYSVPPSSYSRFSRTFWAYARSFFLFLELSL